MEQTPSPQAPQEPVQRVYKHEKHKKSNKALKVIPWVGLVLFVVLAAAVGYFYATKQIGVSFLGGVARTAVCDDAVVTRYNTASKFEVRSGSSEASIDTAGITALATEIATKPHYADDATCQTVIFWAAIQNADAAKATSALAALNDLHAKGEYVDSNLSNAVPLSGFQEYIKGLSSTQGQ